MHHKAVNSLKTIGLDIISNHVAFGTNPMTTNVVNSYHKVVNEINVNLPKAEQGNNLACHVICVACIVLIEDLENLFKFNNFYIFEFGELKDIAEAVIDEVNDMAYDEQAHDMLAELTDDED